MPLFPNVSSPAFLSAAHAGAAMRRGDEEPLRGRKAVVYLRDRQQRDLDNGGLIAELSRHVLCRVQT
ncbi:hypothetical protein ALC57_05854 [Trachymyrmex cornetzi]|uniref:Uncharacterized protein n=1 Tax=Trachymyrmex cornetzi TaxID=471704 RepID=A0A151J9X6_9HYME|nr:hypothetical protein ALC57_05854 [Trachymyrmex cornetzi]